MKNRFAAQDSALMSGKALAADAALTQARRASEGMKHVHCWMNCAPRLRVGLELEVIHQGQSSACRLLLLVIALCLGCSKDSSTSPRVLFIGMDGMDPILLQQYMDQGKLPNFKRLADTGGFQPLATSMPPQSPVAWSNVISGCDPGTHEIYDFIHRHANPKDPKMAIEPYLSTSSIEAASVDRGISVGKWRIPLSSSTTVLHREGPTFWDYLTKHGVDATIYRMPANYPALDSHGDGHFQCLTGMGTPDLLGSYGEFTLFSALAPPEGRSAEGGKFKQLRAIKNRAELVIDGLPNFLLKPDEKGNVPTMTAKLEVARDPERDLVMIRVGEKTHILKQGEWSDWTPVVFETGIPGSTLLSAMQAPTSIGGMVRIYVKSVRPIFELFVTPINIDPSQPAIAISAPPEFAMELAQSTGPYFTAGIPEHTAEIQKGALDEDQWLGKANLILEERLKQYHYALKHFKSGCLFFYFGTPDQISHIFWRDQDPGHPGRDPKHGDKYAKVIEDTYIQMDKIVGEALEAIGPQDTLIVMSDHGFTSFRRGFNLNTWLLKNGYIHRRITEEKPETDPDADPNAAPSADTNEPEASATTGPFADVDWKLTTAYGIGLNGLYINQKGREKHGIVDSDTEKKALLKKLTDELLAVRDVDGSPVIDKIYDTAVDYAGANPDIAPDLLIGYARNYRAGWATILGDFTEEVLEDNRDRWSGDHCIAAHLVPGILVTNRKVNVRDADLRDLAPTILNLFNVPKPAELNGRPIINVMPNLGKK